MKEIKVIYIINHSVPYGANKALINILDEVINKGVNPLIITAFSGGICKDLDSRKIPYKIVPHFFLIYPPSYSLRDKIYFIPRLLRDFLVNRKAIKELAFFVKEFKADIIHTNIGPDHIGFYVAKKLNLPHIWHIREYQNLDFNMHPFPSMNGFIKKLRSSRNYPIAITKGIQNHFSMTKNARVIYDGVMKRSNFRFEATKEKYFLFVGRLEETKGIQLLVEAYIEFCNENSDFELLIAGDGVPSYTLELKKMIDEVKLSERVHFLGFRADVFDLMAKATAIVVPSRHEGFGFITAEAMFNGCLVIGNNSGGTKEILEGENLGILYSGKEELINSMKSVVSNGIDSYFPLIKKAQNRALSLYSQEQNGAKIYDLYQEILNNK